MKRCVICGASLGECRSDRRTCSAKCRVALSRRLRQNLPKVRAALETAITIVERDHGGRASGLRAALALIPRNSPDDDKG